MSLVGTLAAEVARNVEAGWEDSGATRLAYLGTLGPRPHRREVHQDREADVLDAIAPAEYVEALTGIAVPRHGFLNCPLPDHEDQTPSFKVYDTPEDGWYCFGCGRGGDIFSFAAELWGMSTYGPAFLDLRRELARALLRGSA